MFLHSYANNSHEKKAAKIVKDKFPSAYLAVSSELIPEFREYERLTTTVLNAYLGPVLINYLSKLVKGIKKIRSGAPIYISQSDGGISSPKSIASFPVRTAYSGPSAGVVGSAALAEEKKIGRNIISLDIGGTSTDVALVKDFKPAKTVEKEILGFPIKFPTVDILTIGAGGGSIASVEYGHLKVGPGSAGANPGPACYNREGREPTVTDANLILGLIGEDTMLGNKISLDRQKAEKAIKEKICYPFDWSIEEGAWAINRIISDNISNEIRKITLSQGINPGSLKMVAYGGAGPMHAADICRDLGIGNAVIPANPGVFSAAGLFSCNKTMDFVTAYSKHGRTGLKKAIKGLSIKGRRWFGKENIPKSSQKMDFFADMRYRGQNYEINVPIPSLNTGNDKIWNNLVESFNKKHSQVYGHFKKGAAIEIVNIRLKCIGRSKIKVKHNFMQKAKGAPIKGYRDIMFLGSGGRIRTPIYDKMRMDAARKIEGPAVIEQVDSTIVIPPQDSAVMGEDGDLVINIFKGQNG